MADTAVAAPSDLVLVEHQGPLAIVRINRPAALNALNAETLQALHTVLCALASAVGVRAVVLTGAGDKAFVAGADIAAMHTMAPAQALALSQLGAAVADQIVAMPQVVIAAVNGFALGGGCEMALACDIVVASRKAKFGLPEVTLGVIPGFGGTQRLLRQIGRYAAKRWVLSGDLFSAEEAQRYGVVQDVFEPEELLIKAIELASRIASRGPLAVAAAKRVIDAGADMTLPAATVIESQAFAQCFATADQREGMTAFLGKRPAQFAGN